MLECESNVAGKITPELVRRLSTVEPGREVSLIITMKEPGKLDALREKGFTVQHVLDNLPGASGTARADAVTALADIEAVEAIDFDAPGVRALDAD